MKVTGELKAWRQMGGKIDHFELSLNGLPAMAVRKVLVALYNSGHVTLARELAAQGGLERLERLMR